MTVGGSTGAFPRVQVRHVHRTTAASQKDRVGAQSELIDDESDTIYDVAPLCLCR